MKTLKVIDSNCPKNHKCPCISICPVGAISQQNITSLPIINQEKCIKCKKCISMCPKQAFFME